MEGGRGTRSGLRRQTLTFGRTAAGGDDEGGTEKDGAC